MSRAWIDVPFRINVDRKEISKLTCGELSAWFFHRHDHLLTHLTLPSLPEYALLQPRVYYL